MKENELRIGNWIKYEGNEIQLTKQKFKLCVFTLGLDELHEPIPLTEEWLVKFGFIKNTTSWTNFNRPNYTKEVKLNIQGKYLFYNGLIIGSVHQLQNLYFALTGTELEVQ
jgi:hypothetical protein